MAITISGQNNNDKILASDGVLDSISGFNVVGVMTAAQFDVTGKTTTNHISIGNNIHLGNAGIITATTLIGNVTGNINHESNLLLQISGSEKFRVGNGGQFGIAGANYGTAGQVFTSGGSGSAPTWSTINSDKITEGNTEAEVVDTGSDGHFKVTTEGTERLRITSTGSVGIGEDAPVAKVHIAGSNYVSVGGGGFDSNVVLAITRNFTVGQSAGLALNSGASATSFIHLGDADDPDIGKITYDHSNNSMSFTTNANERLRIDSAGRLLLGGQSARIFGGGTAPHLQIEGLSEQAAHLTITRVTNDTYGSVLGLAKSRGTSLGSNTIVQNNDTLGVIQFRGTDGSDIYSVAASIHAEVDGSPSDGTDMPGALVLGTTADGASSPTERLRIASDGKVHINYNASSNAGNDKLNIMGGGDGITIARSTSNASDGNILGNINFHSYMSGSYHSNAEAKIQAIADTGQSGSSAPTHLDFYTKPSGVSPGSSPSLRLRIASDGKIGINESSPQQQLHVHEDTIYNGILINGNVAPRIAFARSTTTTGEWSVGIDGTNGNNFAINSSNDNSNNKIIISSTDISLYGQVNVPNGNVVMGSSHGIDFSADGSGTLKTLPNSFNAELLHDYETGTFTPNIQYDTGTNRYAGANVSSSSVGEYIRIGDMVYFGMKIILTGNRNYSENTHIYIGGMPYNGLHSSQQSSMMNGWGGWACPTNDNNFSYDVRYCFHGYTTVNLGFSQSSGNGGIDGFYVWGFYRTAP